jgi:translocation and assembly module TamB
LSNAIFVRMRSNRLFKIFRYSIFTLAALFVLLLLAVNLPPGQRIITSRVNGFFRDKNIPAHIDRITLLLNGKIGLKELRVIQHSNDTILYVRNLRIAFNPIPLIFKKVKVGSLSMDHAVVNLATDDSTGILNLFAFFPSKPKTKDTKKVKNKQWDFQVKSVSLKNIRFKYSDVYHGVHLKNSLKNLYVRFSRFSILGKEINAAYINMEQIRFHMATNTPRVTKTAKANEPSVWKFNVTNADLKDIAFSSHQPETRLRMVVTLGEGTVSKSHVDLGQHIVDIGLLQLGKPRLVLYSSSEKKQNKSSSNPAAGDAFPGVWDMSGDFLKIEEGSLRSLSYDGSRLIKTGPDLTRFDHFETTLKSVKISSLASAFNMSRLSMNLGNGLKIEQGKVVFRSDSIHKTKLQADLRTTFSHVDMKLLTGETLPSMIKKSFLTVPFSLFINESEISLRDLYSFMPPSDKRIVDQTRDDKLGIQGTLSGSTEFLQINELGLSTPAGLKLRISGSVTRLADIRSAHCSIDFKTNTITTAQVKELTELAGTSAMLPSFNPMVFKGTIRNRMMAPEITIDIQGESGNIGIIGSADLPEKSYIMELRFADLKAGELAGIKDLDSVSGRISIQGKGFKPDSIIAKATVAIDKAGYKGYVYRNLKIEAMAETGIYAFQIVLADTSVECRLTGYISRKDSIIAGEVSGNFKIQTGNLHLYRDSIDFAGDLKAVLRQNPSEISASLDINNLVLKKKGYSGILKRTFVSFLSNGSLIKTHVESDFLKADFQSHVSLTDFKKAFKIPEYGLSSLVDSSFYYEIPVMSALPDADLTIEAGYSPLINLFIADSLLNYKLISVQLTKETQGIVKGEIYLDKYRFMNTSGYATSIQLESSSGKASFFIKTDSIQFRNINLGTSQTGLIYTQNKADITLRIGGRNKGILYNIACEAIKRNKLIELRSTIPEWTLNGYDWSVSSGQFLIFEPETKNYTVDLHWKNSQSMIDLYGGNSDKINLDLKQVAISKLVIPGIIPYSFDGILNGSVSYRDGLQNIITASMEILQVQAAGQIMGDISVKGQYLSDTLGSSEGNVNILMEDAAELSVSAKLGTNPAKSIHTKFKNLSLNYLAPFLQKYISGLTGKINGGVDLTFPAENPELNGLIRLSETGFRIIPLNAKYTIPNDEIVIKKNEIVFNQFVVLDSLRKRLNVIGKINMNSKPNPTADLQITSDNLQVMNTTEKDNPAFNGDVFINAKLNIVGPVQNPSISGNLVLAGGTVINYRYMENLAISETEKTIKFASLKPDQTAEMLKRKAVKNLSNSPHLETSIEIDPRSIFNFQINRGFDIGAHISGGGFLNYAMLPNSSMSLSGRYEIQQGRADLKIVGWPRKNFIISPGSYLRWDGKVDDPEMNIETTSKVKGSYINPVDNKSREVDFNVNMKLANRLSQLEIIFDVMSNDQYITSVLNSLSKDERMKQAINLLIFEKIELPNMESSSSYVSQQINQFWESQLNQFTKSAIKNVDISFGVNTYKGASEGGGEQEYTSLSYEVKKQMFHERGSVMVSGKMNDNSVAGEQTNNVIDNFTFEYALDTNRSKYVKIYRQQNYEDLLEGEVIKSGVGFIYRRNYDRLSDIWRRQKKKPNPKP